ncbi:MAG: tyrosine-type recombinase/integrase [Caldilineaceae bacterium]|nr:tyrosine-type recombinase/integrase [Caldilineaceae bacterium]
MSTASIEHPATQLERELQEFLIDRRARNLTPKTLHWYTHNLTHFADYAIAQGIEETVAIKPRHIRRFLISLAEEGYNDGGVYAVFGALRAYLRWFVIEYEPSHWANPLDKVESPKRPQELQPPISLDDFKAMLDACKPKTFTGDRDKAILLFLLDTGVRHQELTDLQRGDVDVNTGQVIIRRGKGRKGRVVFLGAKTRRALLTYFRHYQTRLEDAPLWVTETGTALTRSGIRQVIRRRALQAELEEPGLHEFRRAFALNYLRNGGDIITLQRLLGHSSLVIINRYLNLLDDDLRAAIEKHGVVDKLL